MTQVPTSALFHAKNSDETLWCGADYLQAWAMKQITSAWPMTTCKACQEASTDWKNFPNVYVPTNGEPEEWA